MFLQVVFGLLRTGIENYLRFGKRILIKVLSRDINSKIGTPSKCRVEPYKQAVREKRGGIRGHYRCCHQGRGRRKVSILVSTREGCLAFESIRYTEPYPYPCSKGAKTNKIKMYRGDSNARQPYTCLGYQSYCLYHEITTLLKSSSQISNNF